MESYGLGNLKNEEMEYLKYLRRQRIYRNKLLKSKNI
tara:strand:- start:4025 stop:4135 length:111 start_codon:yes stop_codon:yes gene_type:complete